MTDVHNDELADEDFDTVLSHDIDFTGVITFEKSFLVRGRISGEISSGAVLLIDEGAVVEANISAQRIIIKGSVTGDVKAGTRLEISPTGRLLGNVLAPEINFESGCVFNGKCTMSQQEQDSQPEPMPTPLPPRPPLPQQAHLRPQAHTQQQQAGK
jgi:cytoskeletal protein CcmA (bactofilin family)